MNVQNKEDSKLVDSQNVDKNIDKSRRSFAKTSVIAPIIMGFASRPAWATMDNCSFGQALSGNLSQHPATCDSDTLSTHSPGFYQGNIKNWSKPNALIPNGTSNIKFSSVFGSPTVSITYTDGTATNTNPTLWEVIKATGGKKGIATVTPKPNSISSSGNAVTNHYVAAYLNSISPVMIFPFTSIQIKNDWGVWNLFSTLQNIQSGELTALQANQYINFYN